LRQWQGIFSERFDLFGICLKESADDFRQINEYVTDKCLRYKVTISELIINKMNNIVKLTQLDNEELRNIMKQELSEMKNELIKWNEYNERDEKKLEGVLAVKEAIIN
jgi:hypothetical protein